MAEPQAEEPVAESVVAHEPPAFDAVPQADTTRPITVHQNLAQDNPSTDSFPVAITTISELPVSTGQLTSNVLNNGEESSSEPKVVQSSDSQVKISNNDSIEHSNDQDTDSRADSTIRSFGEPVSQLLSETIINHIDEPFDEPTANSTVENIPRLVTRSTVQSVIEPADESSVKSELGTTQITAETTINSVDKDISQQFFETSDRDLTVQSDSSDTTSVKARSDTELATELGATEISQFSTEWTTKTKDLEEHTIKPTDETSREITEDNGPSNIFSSEPTTECTDASLTFESTDKLSSTATIQPFTEHVVDSLSNPSNSTTLGSANVVDKNLVLGTSMGPANTEVAEKLPSDHNVELTEATGTPATTESISDGLTGVEISKSIAADPISNEPTLESATEPESTNVDIITDEPAKSEVADTKSAPESSSADPVTPATVDVESLTAETIATESITVKNIAAEPITANPATDESVIDEPVAEPVSESITASTIEPSIFSPALTVNEPELEFPSSPVNRNVQHIQTESDTENETDSTPTEGIFFFFSFIFFLTIY